MFGKKKAVESDHENQIGKPATALGRSCLLFSILLGALGVILLIIGAAKLQHRLYSLGTLRGAKSSAYGTYNDAFQSAHYTPYPDSTTRQWQFVWFLISASVFVFAMTTLLTSSAVRILQWSAALIGLHVYVLVYCTYGIDTFLWINHNKVVRGVFGKAAIGLTLAGLFTMAVAHGLCILSLGLIPNKRHLDNRYVQGSSINERIIEKQVAVPVAASRDSAHETQESHFERRETPTFTNNPAQPVRVHMGGTTNTTGATELGARRY